MQLTFDSVSSHPIHERSQGLLEERALPEMPFSVSLLNSYSSFKSQLPVHLLCEIMAGLPLSSHRPLFLLAAACLRPAPKNPSRVPKLSELCGCSQNLSLIHFSVSGLWETPDMGSSKPRPALRDILEARDTASRFPPPWTPGMHCACAGSRGLRLAWPRGQDHLTSGVHMPQNTSLPTAPLKKVERVGPVGEGPGPESCPVNGRGPPFLNSGWEPEGEVKCRGGEDKQQLPPDYRKGLQILKGRENKAYSHPSQEPSS